MHHYCQECCTGAHLEKESLERCAYVYKQAHRQRVLYLAEMGNIMPIIIFIILAALGMGLDVHRHGGAYVRRNAMSFLMVNIVWAGTVLALYYGFRALGWLSL